MGNGGVYKKGVGISSRGSKRGCLLVTNETEDLEGVNGFWLGLEGCCDIGGWKSRCTEERF